MHGTETIPDPPVDRIHIGEFLWMKRGGGGGEKGKIK